MQPPPDYPLVPLPTQPEATPWPTTEWQRSTPSDVGADEQQLNALLDEMFEQQVHPGIGQTFACGVVARGQLVAERYGKRVVRDVRAFEPNPPLEDVTAQTELLSWSMAKSITSLAVGVAVSDGHLNVGSPVGEPIWQDGDDPRAKITWEDLLTMRPGLKWEEEYYDLGKEVLPDVVTMLFGDGAKDTGAYAADFELINEPGTPEAYAYSSGTTNIIAKNLQRLLGLSEQGMRQFLEERIFAPTGMSSATADFDEAGTFIGSSYVHANLQDWCRFGLVALRGGQWDAQQLVPSDWMDWSRIARSWNEGYFHGAHWWAWDDPETPFGAHGFEGQRVIAFPARDVVVVRLGHSGALDGPALNSYLFDIARCFPKL